MDREKVIKGLEICLNGHVSRCHGNSKCPYYIFDDKHPRGDCEYNQMLRDALAMLKEQQEQIDRLIEENASNAEMAEGLNELLKEQEAVKPIYIENPYTHLPVSYCPKCREPISKFITGNPYKETKYCHYCGQAVKWE